MEGGQWMVVMIVAVVLIASIFKSRAKFHYHNEGTSPETKAETMRLREEVAQLKDRIKVLERIAVEKEDSLTKQIEELRDR
jgi:hypothetical protein